MKLKKLTKILFIIACVLLVGSSFAIAKKDDKNHHDHKTHNKHQKTWDKYDKERFLMFNKHHKEYFIVEFCNESNSSLQKIQNEGVEIIDEFDNKYIVKINHPRNKKIKQESKQKPKQKTKSNQKLKHTKKDFILMNKTFVCNIELYDESIKLSPALKQKQYFSWATDNKNNIWLYISLFEDANLNQTIKLLENKSFHVNGSIEDTKTLLVKTKIKQIKKLSKIPQINWIEQVEAPVEDKIYNIRNTLNINTLHGSSYDLSGEGIKILQYENWVPFSHSDYKDRLILPSKHNNYASHPTVGAGIMIGNGSINPNMKGIAPKAQIVAKGSIATNYRLLDWVNTHKKYIKDYDVDLSNNAWGIVINSLNNYYECLVYDKYRLFQKNIDSMVYNYGIPIVWAAGNERGIEKCTIGEIAIKDFSYYTTILPKATSKNVITVGSIDLESEQVSHTSSWGPTNDGRLKPEIVAPGCSVGHKGMWSTTTDDFYNNKSKFLYGLGMIDHCGTSISTFETSGAIALIIEKMQQEFGEEYKPYPSTLKALLVDSAKDIDLKGPDFKTGYGVIQPESAIKQISKKQIIEQNITKKNKTHKYYTYIKTGENFKVTLAWDDIPANILSLDKKLVNDLDIYVLSPKGNKFYPWSFNLDNLDDYAKRSKANDLDNLEQVYITKEEIEQEGLGNWIIVVNASRIKRNSQKYSLATKNGFGYKEEPNINLDGLVAWYKFDGNANDSSDNKNHGIVYGAILAEDRFGNPNSAYYFDGVDDRVEVPILFNQDQDPITLVAWVRLEVPPSQNYHSILYGESVNNGIGIRNAFLIYDNTYQLVFDQFRPKWSFAISNTSVELGEWQFISIVKENDIVRFYVDSNLVNEMYHNESYNDLAPTNAYIGARGYQNYWHNEFKGYISDISLWERGLSQDEINNLYLS